MIEGEQQRFFLLFNGYHLRTYAGCRSAVEGKMRRNFSASVFGIFFWLIFVDIVSAQRGGTWELGASMPVARQELATGVLDGRVYVIGGFDENGSSTATVQVYDPLTVVLLCVLHEHRSVDFV